MSFNPVGSAEYAAYTRLADDGTLTIVAAFAVFTAACANCPAVFLDISALLPEVLAAALACSAIKLIGADTPPLAVIPLITLVNLVACSGSVAYPPAFNAAANSCGVLAVNAPGYLRPSNSVNASSPSVRVLN